MALLGSTRGHPRTSRTERGSHPCNRRIRHRRYSYRSGWATPPPVAVPETVAPLWVVLFGSLEQEKESATELQANRYATGKNGTDCMEVSNSASAFRPERAPLALVQC